MEELEIITNKNKLDEKQTTEFIKVYCIYKLQKMNLKVGNFHEEKYNTYDSPHFVKEIKKGKTPLEIMNKIVTECENYSRAQIFEKHLGKTNN